MITAVHTLIYSDDAPATRAFFRDVLGFPCVSDASSGTEAGPADEAGLDPLSPQSWLIFSTGPSELGVHPTRMEHGGEEFTAPRHHQVSFIVADIEEAAATIRAKGGVIESGPTEMGFGTGIEVAVPGADAILLYQPKHVTAYQL